MILKIDNDTGLLSEYFFQMLCLMYFHGEKFPRSGDKSLNSAYFSLHRSDNGFYSKVVVSNGINTAEGCASVSYSDLLHDRSQVSVAAAASGRAFLISCKKLFGFVTPWGLLTGIRPVKRAFGYLAEGLGEERAIEIFTHDFWVSESKAKLCVTAAKAQKRMLEGISEKDCSLYVAIPFCPTRCEYCSFVSYSGEKLFALIPDYVERLILDLGKTAKLISECDMNLRSIYIGGGTPTILSVEQIKRITGTISESFDMSGVLEFTLEAGRPDTITIEKLTAAKESGVDRVSINPQTLDENILRAIGRKHSVSQFFTAYNYVKKLGFKINTDLIAALPGDTALGFERSLDEVLYLKPDNITIHTLALKNAAAIREKNYNSDPNDDVASMSLEIAAKKLNLEDYKPYYLYRQKNTSGNGENCGYSLPGKECLYNVLMMEDGSTVFGCGASAVTKIVKDGDINRFAFPKYPYEYLSGDRKDIFEGEIKRLLKEKDYDR